MHEGLTAQVAVKSKSEKDFYCKGKSSYFNFLGKINIAILPFCVLSTRFDFDLCHCNETVLKFLSNTLGV